MDWVKVLYWISIVILWVLIGMNFWNLRRNRRLSNLWESMIEDLKQKIKNVETLETQYIHLLDEQREAKLDEMDGVLPQH